MPTLPKIVQNTLEKKSEHQVSVCIHILVELTSCLSDSITQLGRQCQWIYAAETTTEQRDRE